MYGNVSFDPSFKSFFKYRYLLLISNFERQSPVNRLTLLTPCIFCKVNPSVIFHVSVQNFDIFKRFLFFSYFPYAQKCMIICKLINTNQLIVSSNNSVFVHFGNPVTQQAARFCTACILFITVLFTPIPHSCIP